MANDLDLNEYIDVDEYIIKAVKIQPFLYDPNNEDYRDDDKRDETFKSIGDPILMTGEEVSKRWKSLRDRLYKERRTIEKKKRKRADVEPTSQWRHYQSLMFLMDYLRPYTPYNYLISTLQTQSSLDSDSQPPKSPTPSSENEIDAEALEGFKENQFEDQCDGSRLDFSSEAVNVGSQTINCHSEGVHVAPQAVYGRSVASAVATKIRKTDSQQDAFAALKSVGEAFKKKTQTPQATDVETAYGKFVTAQLKSLSKKKRSLAQINIHKLLYSLEFDEN